MSEPIFLIAVLSVVAVAFLFVGLVMLARIITK